MKFVFKITEVNKKILVKAPYAALDGDLTILINQLVFFNEQYVPLLELAIHITGWLSELEAGIFTDFDYSPDGYDENPFLHFTRTDNQHYLINSAWAKACPDNMLSLEEITRCFKDFLVELDRTVQQTYGVGFADMPFFSLVKKQHKPLVKSNWAHFVSVTKKMLAKLIQPA